MAKLTRRNAIVVETEGGEVDYTVFSHFLPPVGSTLFLGEPANAEYEVTAIRFTTDKVRVMSFTNLTGLGESDIEWDEDGGLQPVISVRRRDSVESI